MKIRFGFVYSVLIFLLAPSPVSAQLWTSLHEMPSKDTLCVFDADSARFAPGTSTLFPYVDASEMDSSSGSYSGLWDVIHKASEPTDPNESWGMQEGSGTSGVRPPIWNTNRINGHAAVEFNEFTDSGHQGRGFIESLSTLGVPAPWSDFIHKNGQFTLAIVFNTDVNPPTETEVIMATSVNSTQKGFRIQMPSGSDSTRIFFGITNGSSTIVSMNTSGVLVQGTWQILVIRWRYNYSGYDTHIWVNSLIPADSVETTGSPSSDGPTLAFKMGAGISTDDFDCDSLQVAMFAVSDSALIDSDVEALISYLSCRFDLGVSGVTCAAAQSGASGVIRRRGWRRKH